MRKRLGLALVLCAVVSVAGCSSKSTSSTGADTGYVSGNGQTVLIASGDRKTAVKLSGTALDGTQLDISKWRGSTIVVNFWASWCGPCRSEARALEAVNKEFANQNVKFLGLNTRDGLEAAKAFAKRFDTGYPSIQDQDGQLTLAFGNLGPAATPSTIILDSQGRVAARILGPVTESELRSVLTAVIESNK
ncbi:MAG: TlpA disulfide reductase family protein [Actinomycetes bacterium]